MERATWTLSGLDEAVGTERADEVFDAANAGIRTDLAAVGAQIGGLEGLEAFGTSAPLAPGRAQRGAGRLALRGRDALLAQRGRGRRPGRRRAHRKRHGPRGRHHVGDPRHGHHVSVQTTTVVDGVTVTIDTSVKVAPCPDASGQAVAEGSMAASATKDGVGHRFSYAAAVEIQVDDDAEVASTTETFTAEQGDADAGGEEQYVAVSVDAERRPSR